MGEVDSRQSTVDRWGEKTRPRPGVSCQPSRDSGRKQVVKVESSSQATLLVHDEEGGDLGFLHERESRGGEGFRIDRLGPRVKAVAGRAREKAQVGFDQPPQVAVA